MPKEACNCNSLRKSKGFTQPIAQFFSVIEQKLLGSWLSRKYSRAVLACEERASERAVFRGLQLQEAAPPTLDRKKE